MFLKRFQKCAHCALKWDLTGCSRSNDHGLLGKNVDVLSSHQRAIIKENNVLMVRSLRRNLFRLFRNVLMEYRQKSATVKLVAVLFIICIELIFFHHQSRPHNFNRMIETSAPVVQLSTGFRLFCLVRIHFVFSCLVYMRVCVTARCHLGQYRLRGP